MINKTINSTAAVTAAAANVQFSQSISGYESPDSKYVKMANFFDDEFRRADGKKVVVNAKSFLSPYNYKCIINLYDKPVFEDKIQSLDPELRVTRGWYCIKYLPKTDKRRKKGRPWIIGQDLMRYRIVLSGYSHWKFLCERVPEFAWIDRNTNLSKGLFDIAAKHPGVAFFFCVDWVRYEKCLQKQVEEKLDKPFVGHVVSIEEYEEKWADKEMVPYKTSNDILKALTDVERMPEVQKEMAAQGGVYDRIAARGLERDPATGQFRKRSE